MSLNRCFPCLQFQNEEIITKLDCSNTVLTDVFPDVWQYERTLEELYLSSTRINTLPPQLFYCQSLRILVVNNNSLESIPNAIGSLRQLQHLYFSRNLISNVPDSIKSCRNLTHLDLSCNNLQRLPDALTCLISLQELLLNETYLEFLPANFGRLVNLKILELRLNNLITLPKSMARLSSLQRIDIGGNEFTELPEVIGELKQLRELWIDFNQIRRISSNVAKLRELQHFEANGNLVDTLPHEVSHWRNIEVLSVCTNSLETLPFSIGMLKTLVTFKCEMNELRELPDSISHLENLEELVLSHNKLLRLPSTIGMLRKLRFLFADDNELPLLPDELCSCSNLSVLSVSRNKIVELPQNIGHLTKLKVLNLVKNHIATLPVSILSLVNLTSLWISDNQSQPLVPLQYVDLSTKTQLTCFMLPQTSYRVQDEDYQQRPGAGCSSIDLHKYRGLEESGQEYACRLSPFDQRQQQRQICANSSVCSSPTRRICFAEQATILSDMVTQASVANVVAVNNVVGAVPIASGFTDEAAATAATGDSDSGVRLMRSPTPYPKELRLMAKYVRNGQKQPHSKSPEREHVKEAPVMLNSSGANNACDAGNVNVNDVQLQQSSTVALSSSAESAFHSGAQVKVAQADYVMAKQRALQQQQQQIVCGTAPAANPYADMHYQQPLALDLNALQQYYVPRTTYYVTPGSMNDMCAQNLKPSYKILGQHDQVPPEQAMATTAHYYMGVCNLPAVLEPPPYHIARGFTKKTPEDLTNYETMRHQQQQQYYTTNISPLPLSPAAANDAAVAAETAKANCQLVNAAAAGDNYAKNELNSNYDLHAHYDHQNNFVQSADNSSKQQQQLQQQSLADALCATPNALSLTDELQQLTDGQQQQKLNGSLSQLSICSFNSLSTVNSNTNNSTTSTFNSRQPHQSNSGGKESSKKSTWLFGVHKNPTVIQVALKWEHQVGFEVAEMPNKDGIFVSSIVPHTNAACLLSVSDKLLEIDGSDFTSITLSEAKQVILNAGNVMNIMLSRK